MTITKTHITISTLNAKIAFFSALIGFLGTFIGLGIYIGNIQSVNAQQTKDIDKIQESMVTIREFNAFSDNMKGLLQTYLSETKRVVKAYSEVSGTLTGIVDNDR